LGASTNPTRGATIGEKFLCNQNKCHPGSLTALLRGLLESPDFLYVSIMPQHELTVVSAVEYT